MVFKNIVKNGRSYQACSIYNLVVSGEVADAVTCFTGSSTGTGPKLIDSRTARKFENRQTKKQMKQMNKNSEESKQEKEVAMIEAIREINHDAPHQQDQLNYHKDAARTLAAGTHGSAPHLTKTVIEKEEEMMTVVRRLTPTECSRLQGFDEGHLDCMSGDSSKYRSAGNSWAVPCAYFMLSRMHIVGNKEKMVYATVCSGVEAHSQAVKNLGDKAIFFSEIEKPQSQLLAKRYPEVPNFGDFTKIHFDEGKGVITNALLEGEKDELPDCFYHAPVIEVPFKRGELDIISGGIPCFVAGTKVMTDHGNKNIEDVKLGDMVLTHLGRYRMVKGVMTHFAPEELCVINLADGNKIVCTPNHRFYADLHNGEGEWVEARQLNHNWRLCRSELGECKFVDVINTVSTRPSEEGELVYNLSVDFDESYAVENFAVHNCTDVSVAGKRDGMKEGSGTRSSLAFNYQKLIDDLKPQFILYENVPGIFSSNDGRDFIWFVYKMMNAGYSIAWRTLDAQYVMTDEHPRAIPQRRRRLWLVGYKGDDWRIPARVVFERKNDLGNEPPERIPGKGFQSINPEYVSEDNPTEIKSGGKVKKSEELSLFDAFDIEPKKNPMRIANLPEANDFGDQDDITKMNNVNLQIVMSQFGDVGYCGDVFVGDKTPCTENIAEGIVGKFIKVRKGENDLLGGNGEVTESEEALVKVSDGFIGNAGVMSKGRIVTMTCHEWTSGIQLSPIAYKMYNEKKEDKDLLFPVAYDGTVCGLSDILEDDPDEKYNLSWKACYGILKRAQNRGKELPLPLDEALIATIVESAPIVKWVSLNAKKEDDRNAAKNCYDELIEKTYPYEQVKEEEPKKSKSGDEDDEIEDEGIVDAGEDEEDCE